MQKIAIGLIILAVLVGGFYLFNGYIYNEKQGDALERGVVAGVITSVNRDPIAYDGPAEVTIADSEGEEHLILVPARLNICEAFENIADVYALEVGDRVEVTGDVDPESGAIIPCTSVEHYLRAVTTVTSEAAGLSFYYRKGPNGYVLNEVPPSSEDPLRVFAVALMLKTDYDAFMAMTDASEGPPSINITAYTNTKNQSARAWADANPGMSNIALVSGTISDSSFKGSDAVRYLVDGLYPTDTFVVAQDGFIYVISGSYLEAGSTIQQDFALLLDSVRFKR